MYHGEEVFALQAAKDSVLVGGDSGCVGVVNEECFYWRAVFFVLSKRGEGVAKLRHIDDARGTAKRTGEHKVGALEVVVIKWEGTGGGELDTSATMFPGSHE
jgi:hypothetical protein